MPSIIHFFPVTTVSPTPHCLTWINLTSKRSSCLKLFCGFLPHEGYKFKFLIVSASLALSLLVWWLPLLTTTGPPVSGNAKAMLASLALFLLFPGLVHTVFYLFSLRAQLSLSLERPSLAAQWEQLVFIELFLLNAKHCSSYLLTTMSFTTLLWGRYHYQVHYIDGETEAQRVLSIICQSPVFLPSSYISWSVVILLSSWK